MGRPRRGLALVPVVVLVTALLFVVVAFTDALLQAMRSHRLAWQGERALHEADRALLGAVGAWERDRAAALRPGESDTLLSVSSAAMTQRVVRTRLHARAFSLEAEARVQDGGVRPAQRRVGRTVLLDWPLPPALATLTSAGPVTVSASAVLLGVDGTPAGWGDECLGEPQGTMVPAIAAPAMAIDAAATVVGSGGGPLTLTDSAALAFGAAFEHAFGALQGLAAVVTSDSSLSLDLRGGDGCLQWAGDAARSGVPDDCTRRWPIVHLQGDPTVRLTGSSPAQGVILVDGDLIVDPGVRFAGVLLVRGRLVVHAQAGLTTELLGAVLVRDVAGAGTMWAGARAQVSRCAARRALAAAGRAVPVMTHGWSERP